MIRLARRTLMTSALAVIAAPVAVPFILRPARGQAALVTLKLHHYFSAISSVHAKFLAPWARQVEAQSGGRLRIDLFPSMELGGAPAQLIDQARDGVADIVWAMPASTPGRFPRVEVFELPFVPSGRALANSMALQDFSAVHLKDDFRDVRVLCFACRDRGVIHANRPVHAIADLKSLRLAVPNRLAGETARALGAQGIAVPFPQMPMAIAGHVVDACLDPWDVVPALKLNDLFNSHTDFPDAALSTTTFVLAMNKAAYDRLPRDLKAVIDANAGASAAALAGALWDGEAAAVRDALQQRGGAVIAQPTDELARWRHATEPVVTAWLKSMKEKKIDGARLLVAARALIAKYAAMPEPSPAKPKTADAPL
jgi:TRAP-type C4-dicarboxylate transport system substrate-binding protein